MRNACLSLLRRAVVGALVSQALTVHADADSERANLAVIAHELKQIEALVENAAANADTAARLKFHYDWLERDLKRVRGGVEDHLMAPRQPRSLPPLKGEYRQ